MSHPRNFCGRTRREFVWEAGAGFGSVALASLLSSQGFFSNSAEGSEHGSSGHVGPHHTPKAERVIFLFMYGGPSHIDTFDYKPTMKGMDGKTVDVKTFGRGGHKSGGRIVEPRWKGFYVEGPLDFSLTGILHQITSPLAKAAIPIFAISTFLTDYVLVREMDWGRAIEALGQAGMEVLD